jgi:hypothetical protein
MIIAYVLIRIGSTLMIIAYALTRIAYALMSIESVLEDLILDNDAK